MGKSMQLLTGVKTDPTRYDNNLAAADCVATAVVADYIVVDAVAAVSISSDQTERMEMQEAAMLVVFIWQHDPPPHPVIAITIATWPHKS